MKCPYCKSKNTELTYYGNSNPQWFCNSCNRPLNSWYAVQNNPLPKKSNLPLILFGLFILAAVLLILGALSLIPVTLTFWGSSCGWTGGDVTTCEPVAYHTTRPIWLWLWEGGY